MMASQYMFPQGKFTSYDKYCSLPKDHQLSTSACLADILKIGL